MRTFTARNRAPYRAAFAGVLASALTGFAAPVDNPAARFNVPWTHEVKWTNTVTITDFEGASWDEKFKAASTEIVKRGGGIVFFPAGVYTFNDHLLLDSHVIVRGENPRPIVDARSAEYRLRTRFEFPAFVCGADGASNATPREAAFKGIRQLDPDATTHNGVINIHLERGHIKFGCDVYDTQSFIDNFETYGRRHIVFGCILRQSAVPDPRVPTDFQHPWQVWTHRHNGAIDIRAHGDVLVANNRIARSGPGADFAMKGYRMLRGSQTSKRRDSDVVTHDVTFHYDNRPGIYLNYGTVNEPAEDHPHNYARGLEIRENYVYCYGCLAIGFSGDGTLALSNTIRYEPKAYLPYYEGRNESRFTNNNRAIEMRGYRWTVAYNDYEVYSNLHDGGSYGGHYGDGEGLMHEQHCNSIIKDSKLMYNIGNTYLCIWRTPIDGLLIKGNIIRPFPGTMGKWGMPAICVMGERHKTRVQLPVNNCHIVDNITENLGIQMLAAKGGTNNVIRNNRHVGGMPARLQNQAGARAENNTGYLD
jgi:hypothetical protein